MQRESSNYQTMQNIWCFFPFAVGKCKKPNYSMVQLLANQIVPAPHHTQVKPSKSRGHNMAILHLPDGITGVATVDWCRQVKSSFISLPLHQMVLAVLYLLALLGSGIWALQLIFLSGDVNSKSWEMLCVGEVSATRRIGEWITSICAPRHTMTPCDIKCTLLLLFRLFLTLTCVIHTYIGDYQS